MTNNIEQMARERPRDLSQRPSRRDVPRELQRKAAEAIQRNRPIRNVSRCAEGESMTANTEYVLVPKRPTKEIRDALRLGSRRDCPSDELCDVRWTAALASAPQVHSTTPDSAVIDGGEQTRPSSAGGVSPSQPWLDRRLPCDPPTNRYSVEPIGWLPFHAQPAAPITVTEEDVALAPILREFIKAAGVIRSVAGMGHDSTDKEIADEAIRITRLWRAEDDHDKPLHDAHVLLNQIESFAKRKAGGE